jgi:hypothetical protein
MYELRFDNRSAVSRKVRLVTNSTDLDQIASELPRIVSKHGVGVRVVQTETNRLVARCEPGMTLVVKRFDREYSRKVRRSRKAVATTPNLAAFERRLVEYFQT